jgi:16S rRNA C1402 N4-methylase RsmH
MRLVERVHAALAEVVGVGDFAIDATVGNGHDAAHLAALVGASGEVHAFDIQQEALESAERRLEERGLLDHCSLHHVGHEHLAETLPPETRGRTQAIVFNLGYLPGGDKSVITTASTTLKALRAALNWLAPGGILTVIVYRAHPGGKEEFREVEQLLLGLELGEFRISSEQPATEDHSPIAFIVRRREQAEGRPSA